ncbi:hypothetical protein FYJ24_10730 [Actinomycetaceae bacterium WB03_NA08]|uniref:Uncharacterized protein n=1 Tax=Scrofimicrobium canadense TaxID=2652290 RepID=A0A6N7VTW8_9ACTO|nr:hypothetical protein [Scrofimicrobium canadense]MSS85219.1 hypothetical protein [Scrofimicrobium canadense]
MGIPLRSVIHTQLSRLVMESHIPKYASTQAINKAVLRYDPETIVQVREGVGFLPFMIQSSDELMRANVEGLRECRIVWGQNVG